MEWCTSCLRLLLWLCLFYLYCNTSAQETNQQLKSDITDNNIDQQSYLAHRQSSQYRENHKPMFKDCEKYSPKVEEERTADTFVIRVQAVDEDPIDTEGGRLTYTIEELPLTRSYFKINETTGEITTLMPLDRDDPSRQKEVYLTIRAVDDGRPQLADICTIKILVEDINDNVPIFDRVEYETDVSEDLRENSEVLRVIAYDLDDGENSRLTYNFTTSGNDHFDELFKIDPDTGVIYLQQKLLGKQGKQYKATVAVSDNGKPRYSATADVTFTVVDSNKRPPRIEVVGGLRTITLKEDENNFEKPLVILNAESNIDDPSVVFELIKGKTTQTNKDQTFLLTQNNLTSTITLARSLDYETVTEYQLTIRVQNKDQLYASVTINVNVEDVNDEIPTFIELLRGSIVENDKPGAQAMTVRAIDKDGTSPNNVVVYELLTYRDLFEIDNSSGVITAKTSFDREKEKVYHVIVQARDSAPSALFPSKKKPNVADQTFPISIEDQNDNQPKFTKAIYYVYDISEGADTQKDVTEVKAVDEDTASRIEYSIIEGNVDDDFVIERTTGRIKVNKKLDYEKRDSYNLTVQANDGIFTDTAKVIIQILNENDETPKFKPYNKNITFLEENISGAECIIKLTAFDPDIRDQTADQKIIYQVREDYKSFLSVGKTDGCVKITKPLDRDYPNGSPSYQAYISAHDNNGESISLLTLTDIYIILEDINDNAPYLVMKEVVWYENQDPGVIVNLTAKDNDGPTNGAPFTFEIDQSASSGIHNKFSIKGNSLFANEIFDREKQKYYDVPIYITDSGTPNQMSAVSILKVIIGDVNDNRAEDGSSEIFVYKYQGIKTDIEIGRVYVTDPDDWDLSDKVFQLEGVDDNFYVNPMGGMITMRKDTTPNIYKLQFKVTEDFNHASNVVNADVTITVKDIPEEAVRKSGSIRLQGITSEEFVEKDSPTSPSKKDLLQRRISEMFNTSLDNVDVFTVLPSYNSTYVDVRFSAHGSPYYSPEKLNNKATEHQGSLEQDLGVEFVMISINECLQPNICLNGSCSNILQIGEEPAVVFTNKTSFVGVKAVAKAVCECRTRMTNECFNGGTPIEDGRCNCPEGFDGPNCEILGISFAGNGWAMYPTFDSCNQTVISFSVLPQTDDGLIFYIGPLSRRQAISNNTDFLSVELRSGFVVLKVNLGDSNEEFTSEYKKINDGAIHKIKINYTTVEIQIEVDECPSDCIKWANFKKSGLLKVNGPLQVGGRSTIFTAEESKMTWSNPPSNLGFKGCITNFTYNSFVYNLGAPSDKYHAHEGTCDYSTYQAAKFGIDSNFLVAILVCLAILLILLLAVVVHKRKQDNFNEKDMDDTRENIINYEDEGGGECDTNFDLSVLRNNIDEKPPMTDTLYKQAPEVPADIGSFLDNKKRACDKDNLPCDDVRHYGYEGDGNSSGSLSSLASCTDEGDLKFNYLSSFGPRFRKLADMYGDDASEEGSQNGAEESWC